MITGSATVSIFSRTAVARRQAESLLHGLIEAKAVSERRLAELRQTDPLKQVTGASSIDNAIQSTRRMIETIDRSMRRVRDRLGVEDAELAEQLALVGAPDR
ncbi:MAG: hypothetical protein IPJ41_06355 [Phycisphaerales bacterium]|nr:hypothetical protein [Phycisphaerales bacterium]